MRNPIVIAGLPRTGSTLLHHLLASDPQFRWLTAAEAMRPTAAAEDEQSGTTAAFRSALRLARQRAALHRFLAPEASAMHALKLGGPEECTPILAATLASLQTSLMFHVPSFSELLLTHDHTSTYLAWRSQIQLLRADATWLLKSPFHILGYDALWNSTPDARLVHVRRDPVEFFTSFLNLVRAVRSAYTSKVDQDLAAEWLDTWPRIMDRASAQLRDPARSFITLDYDVLIKKPMLALEQLYGWLQLNPPPDRAALFSKAAASLQRSPPTRPLTEFGLSEQSVRAAFDRHSSGPFLAPPN
jgi:hypothetical protein